MAEVIRPGRNEPGWTKDIECVGETGGGMEGGEGCGALLRVTKADLFTRRESCMGSYHTETVLPCPCCGTETVLSEPFEGLPDAEAWYDAHPDVLAANRKRMETMAAVGYSRGA